MSSVKHLVTLPVPGVWGLSVWVPGRPLGRGGNLRPPFPPGPTPRPSYHMFWRENYQNKGCLQSILPGQRKINKHLIKHKCTTDFGIFSNCLLMRFVLIYIKQVFDYFL